MNKFKKVAWSILIGAFFLIGFFHQNVLSYIYQHSIQSYIRANFGCKLEYQNAYFQGNHFIIESPSLPFINEFTAKKLSLAWSFSLRTREISISIELDHPSWTIDSSQTFNKKLLEKAFPRKKAGFKCLFDLTIYQGIFTWLAAENSRNQILFDAKTSSCTGGFIKIYADETTSSSQYLSIATHLKPHFLSFSFDCHQIECDRFVSFFKLFFPSLDAVKISSGILTGLVKANFPYSRRPYLEGELFIENAAFTQTNSFQGTFEKAKISIVKNPVVDQPLTTLATIDFIKPISLISFPKQDIDWEISRLVGNIHLDGYKKMAVQLKGVANDTSHLDNRFKLFGDVNLNAKQAFHVDLNLLFSHEKGSNSRIKLLIQQFDKQKKAEITLNHLTHFEVGFLQNFIASFWSPVKRLEILQGTFNGLIEIESAKEGMQKLNVKHFQASDVHFNYPAVQANGKCDALWGNGTLHLSDLNFSDSLDLEFHLKNGSIQLKNRLTQNLPFTCIQADLSVKKGAIEHSLITLNWMGLKGAMDFEWRKSKELLSIKLEGLVSDLPDIMAEKIKKGLNQAFAHSKLKIFAYFKRKNQKFELTGLLNIQRHQTDEYDSIHFGCDFFKSASSTLKWTPVGWFFASALPLEKYVSPFIFRNGVAEMTGQGEFRGTFNLDKVTLYYNVQNLKLENDNFFIEVKDLYPEIQGKMNGFHQMDLDSFSHHGILPISQAKYEEKNTGLNFTDIDGILYFKNDTLDIQSIETYCQGVNLNGKIFLDYQDPAPGVFSVLLNVPQASGQVLQVQSLLSHLKNTTFFTRIPIDGEISMRNDGMNLKFDFSPQGYQLEAGIQASLADGGIELKEIDLALKGLYFDIDYRHDRECLEISEIQGSLLVGKPSAIEEYYFGGDFIRLQDLTIQDLDCDLWVKNQKKEILRLKASLKELKPGLKTVILSDQSHFSSIYPGSFSCQLKDWMAFPHFDFKSQFKLDDFVNDLLLFKKTGLHCISQLFLNKLSELSPITGKINCHIFLNEKTDKLNYEMKAEKLTFQNSIEHRCQLAARQSDQKWIVDAFKWDDLNAQAEILFEGGLVKIPFLGLQQKEALLLGLNGELDLEQSYFTGKIHLCETSLESISQWPSLNCFAKNWHLKGAVRGAGNVKIQGLLKEPWYHCSLFLEAEVPTFSLRDQLFCSLEPIKLHYDSHRSLSVENVHLDLLQSDEKFAHVYINRLDYEMNQNRLKCPRIDFQIPTAHLSRIGETFHRHFPEWVEPSFKDFFVELKKEGILKGACGFEKNLDHSQFSLKLEDGIYSFQQKNHLLKNFELKKMDHFLYFSATSQKERAPFQIKGKVHWPDLNAGEIILKDLLLDSDPKIAPLKILFSKDSQNTCIQSVKGSFCGMDIDLKGGKRDRLVLRISQLQGKVDLKLNQFTNLLSRCTIEKIQRLQLDGLFTFQGNYGYDYRSEQDFSDNFYFQGDLTSNQPFLKGFKVEKISAHLNYRPKNLEMQGLLIEDPSGKIQADHIYVTQGGHSSSWLFAIPFLSIKNFKPALLRERTETDFNPHSRFKTLQVKRAEIKNSNGELTDSKSWKGEGELHFLNLSRKSLTHPLLTIPAEIILRLGLNPQVLNPVTGTILFDLKDDRFYFTRFKDVYSEGRGSKFYLAETPTCSWMDMQGNLNVRIKMKQYNLLFKLAELFTVSVEGNIKNPTFSLLKQRNIRKSSKSLFLKSESPDLR